MISEERKEEIERRLEEINLQMETLKLEQSKLLDELQSKPKAKYTIRQFIADPNLFWEIDPNQCLKRAHLSKPVMLPVEDFTKQTFGNITHLAVQNEEVTVYGRKIGTYREGMSQLEIKPSIFQDLLIANYAKLGEFELYFLEPGEIKLVRDNEEIGRAHV